MNYTQEKANDLAYALGILSKEKVSLIKSEIEHLAKEIRHKCAENIISIVPHSFDGDETLVEMNKCHNAVINTSLDN